MLSEDDQLTNEQAEEESYQLGLALDGAGLAGDRFQTNHTLPYNIIPKHIRLKQDLKYHTLYFYTIT